MHQTHDVVGGLLADYTGLLHEAAFVLAAVAEAPPDERAEEYDVLMAIESESAPVYAKLVQRSGRSADPMPTRPGLDRQQVTSSVHALFGVLGRTGAALVACDADRIPAQMIDSVRVVESCSKALAHALATHAQPADVERCVWALQLGVAAIERNLSAPMQSRAASPWDAFGPAGSALGTAHAS